MSEKRRGLGRGLGALIPSAPSATERPVDVFFPDGSSVSRETSPDDGHDHDGHDHDSHDHDSGTWAADTEHAERPDTASGESETTGLAPVPGATYAEVPVDQIRPNPRQPRTVFDEDELDELVHSISEIGVLQPIVLRPVAPPAGTGPDAGDGAAESTSDSTAADSGAPETPDAGIRFELIMGERRWRASKQAGRATIPAIVKETDDDDLLRDALLENLHRSQLNPLEEAAAYQQLLDDFGCTQEELAARIGRSRPQVSNTLRLLRLPALVQRRVAAGVLSAGHARALLGLPDPPAMERLAQRIVAEGLSVRSVEEIVALGGDGAEEKTRRKLPRPGGRSPQLEDLAADLSDRLDTRVGISLGRRKGKVTIEFGSMEDLHRILDVMRLREGD